MTRIIYQIVIAKTGEDNENWRYINAGKYQHRKNAEIAAVKIRLANPDYAFIVLEMRHEKLNVFDQWELIKEEVLEHY